MENDDTVALAPMDESSAPEEISLFDEQMGDVSLPGAGLISPSQPTNSVATDVIPMESDNDDSEESVTTISIEDETDMMDMGQIENDKMPLGAPTAAKTVSTVPPTVTPEVTGKLLGAKPTGGFDETISPSISNDLFARMSDLEKQTTLLNLELKKAIDQISKDKGLDRDMLVDTLEDAVRTSVIRKYGENIDVEVSYNDDTGEIQVHQFKIVVEEVEDPDTEIAIEKARELDPSVQLDDEIGFPLKVTDLGRIAAQSAKQVIIQRMRDAEQELIYEEFKDRVGEICSGIIQRRDKGGWIINLGRTEAILPKEEQIPREHYKRGDRVQALIIEVRKEGRGPQVVISRAHRDYTAALFRREVPEVDDGTVQIMGVARDPGRRRFQGGRVLPRV